MDIHYNEEIGFVRTNLLIDATSLLPFAACVVERLDKAAGDLALDSSAEGVERKGML